MSTPPATILVVDDDRLNQMLLSHLLTVQGYAVVAAANGRIALEIIATQPIDAVLLDLMMPELDGFGVLDHLKNDPLHAHIPVIVISALDELDSVIRCIEMGAADHLAKPVDPVFLYARLNASLATKRLRDQEQAYLHAVSHLTAAAADMQDGRFDPASLQVLCERSDELGRLARVFNHMAFEVRAREQHLEEQNRVKSAFIGRMTHELRSPFVAAGFSLELIRRYAAHNMTAQLVEQVDHLGQELAAGRRLIDGMITFASLVSRQGHLHRETISPQRLIRQATAHLTALATSRGVTLSYNVDLDVPDVVVDANHLGEAIAQLVHNGIKFTPAGGAVTIMAWVAHDYLTVKVTDTGCGIPAEQLALIWEVFNQTADDERRSVEGLGLGLPLVKQVVTLHGGEVVAFSKPDQGSTFGFRVPAHVETLCPS